MQINQETFEKVLKEVVILDKQHRYLKHGKKLRFGPDILVESPPEWTKTPLTAVTKGNNALDDVAGGKNEKMTI